MRQFAASHPGETLIVVTADHETGGMGMASLRHHYNQRLDLLAHQRMSKDAFAEWTSSVIKSGNAPAWEDMKGELARRVGLFGAVAVDEADEEALKALYETTLSHMGGDKKSTLYSSFDRFTDKVYDLMSALTGVGWTTGDHSGAVVPVFAEGEGQQLFAPAQDNVDIPVKIMKAVRALRPMIGLRHLLPLAAAMAVGACTDRHEHISAVYESDGCLVSLTGITKADGSVWMPDDSLAAASPLASPSPLIDAVFADGISRFGMMLASDSSCGGLEADMAVAVGGSLLDPDGAVAMLRRQACQTDFGGWPISEGALLWIPAAWSAFCATSDTVWLREAYGVAQDIIARSLEVGWDSSLGLLRGSMPAWSGEQQLPYPRWADAVRRFESVSLTANVALAEAIAALERMRAVADAGGECPAVGASYVRRRVNSLLWDPSRGRYSAYLYGGRLMDMQAPVTDNIGQAMAMIWGVASEPMVSSVLSRTGYIRGMVPDLYPLMAGMKVEAALTGAPMMQTLWAMAAVMDSREESLLAAIASLCRLHASEPESGASSWLALLVMRVVFGIGLQPATIGFHPSVPQCLGGGLSLNGLRYGDAVVDVAIKGFGNRVARFEIDGVPSVTYNIADSLSGYHKVEILMANNTMTR